MPEESNVVRRALRRVVTGEGKDGKSMLVSNTLVEPIETPLLPGAQFFSIWGADREPTLPNDGARPSYRTWFPPDGGFRFELISIPPERAADTADRTAAKTEEAIAETEERLPGLLETMEPGTSGLHRTDTVDLIYIASGSCVLQLDSGTKIELETGDTVVQNGARHTWRNPNAQPCKLLTISLGVKRESAGGPSSR
ncbi:MAG TPA: cupin domain-containing protein [Methyloceanibacter sp.]|nr:cupin domain-containing protein [Methyloceanibacter sp.]